ncbi:hypothetical protein SLA2020_031720 [Shorea laevis]
MLVRHGSPHRTMSCAQGSRGGICCQCRFIFAFPSDKTEHWSSWAKEMLVDDGFVEIFCATGVLKSVVLSQTLHINGNVECLHRLVRRWCMSSHTFVLAFGEITVTLEDVENMMLLPIVGEEDPWHIALTSEERTTQIDLKKLMRMITSASSRSWRGEYNIDFPS